MRTFGDPTEISSEAFGTLTEDAARPTLQIDYAASVANTVTALDRSSYTHFGAEGA